MTGRTLSVRPVLLGKDSAGRLALNAGRYRRPILFTCFRYCRSQADTLLLSSDKKIFSHFFKVGKAGPRGRPFVYFDGMLSLQKTTYAMQRTGKYTKDDPMSDLVSDNYRILLLMSRFGIGLGFGESSIGEVCRANGVDTSTFLIVTNMMLYDEIPADAYDKVSMEGLLSYLHNSHDYFLGFRLPAIREKLAAAVGTGSDLSRAIMKYFDDYTAGVHTHMAYEEEVVFPYVRALLEGRRQQDYSIDIFSRHHDQVETLLTEFKNILIKYYPSASTNEINNVLFDIFNCENDLASHNAVEDLLFVPAVGRLEKRVEEEG